MAQNHNNLGNLLKELGKHEEAREEYQAARDILAKLVAQFPAVPEYLRLLATVHMNLGVLLANLGTERIALKSIEYEGIAETGLQTKGGFGWYEQPEERYGIRNRLLPRVLESGQTADLPMVHIGVISQVRDLKIWLTDFNDHRYYIDDNDIARVRRDVEKYLETSKETAAEPPRLVPTV